MPYKRFITYFSYFQVMQQQAALMAATGQGHYLAPAVTLAHVPQAVTALAAPNGLSTAAMTPTTASIANGKYHNNSLNPSMTNGRSH